ncbi:phosphoadenosine phosphosulfate reductase family protein [Paenibacillus alkaliterrae]|uniref:phosphoadenosine phosphosulfate reductase domain-containing protein n=1 Tax=Paenibacillus alkaliterrae TaxID=320909 RepID=UPI001F3394FF|nr:phosphoadenosine phosphosulfate reductase family protein [Paenibacillus alkaliterrae]MCF2940673.1 phosphoadenosine phosphosulfate reductase family protein [Paenibacillus alkaliterrae]
MERYTFVEQKHMVTVDNRLKDYNHLTTDVWDYLEEAGFLFHGTVRDWTAVFFQQTFYVLHHFIKDQPQQDCFPADSGMSWKMIFERDTEACALFSFLERIGFQMFIPVQAMIDAIIDDGEDWHYQSPKHKFQMYCLHGSCSLLIEVYMQNKVPPYGANREPQPYPEDRCQPFLDFDVETLETGKRSRARVTEGETLDILEKLDEDLMDATRERIKKIYDENSRIGLLNSGGKDSRLVLQLMIEHAIKHPDPSKKIMVISADTLVENPGVKSIIHDLKNALADAMPWVEYHIVEPREDNTLLVCIIGKGYQAPSVTFKYCVRRLKIEPARDFLEAVFLAEGVEDTCLVMGSRDNESGDRKRSLQKYFGEEFYGHHPVGAIRTASPIRDWTSQEVVTFLAFNRAPWSRYGARNTELLAFYGAAVGSECPLGAAVVNDNEAMMQCGKSARTGCYLCTISNDRSMGNLISSFPEYEKYYRFRGILKAIGQDIRYGGMVGLQRIGKSKIGSGIGDLTIDARSHLLEAMIDLGIEWRESEIRTAYQMVLHRETVEGFPVTRRFREAIYKMLGITSGFRGLFFHPVFDPYGTGVDQFTAEDESAIRRIMEEKNKALVNA